MSKNGRAGPSMADFVNGLVRLRTVPLVADLEHVVHRDQPLPRQAKGRAAVRVPLAQPVGAEVSAVVFLVAVGASHIEDGDQLGIGRAGVGGPGGGAMWS